MCHIAAHCIACQLRYQNNLRSPPDCARRRCLFQMGKCILNLQFERGLRHLRQYALGIPQLHSDSYVQAMQEWGKVEEASHYLHLNRERATEILSLCSELARHATIIQGIRLALAMSLHPRLGKDSLCVPRELLLDMTIRNGEPSFPLKGFGHCN